MIDELEEYADEWDLYKHRGFYNVAILVGSNPKAWMVYRGYTDRVTAIRESIEKHKEIK